MDFELLEKKSLADLRVIAKAVGIKSVTLYKKSELLEKLRELYDKNAPEPEAEETSGPVMKEVPSDTEQDFDLYVDRPYGQDTIDQPFDEPEADYSDDPAFYSSTEEMDITQGSEEQFDGEIWHQDGDDTGRIRREQDRVCSQ